jgi:hypothetical protein
MDALGCDTVTPVLDDPRSSAGRCSISRRDTCSGRPSR